MNVDESLKPNPNFVLGVETKANKVYLKIKNTMQLD